MIGIAEATTKQDILQAIQLRREVLVKEYKHSTLKEEPDKHDLLQKSTLPKMTI